jgi:glucose/arabinose dehydrogenase
MSQTLILPCTARRPLTGWQSIGLAAIAAATIGTGRLAAQTPAPAQAPSVAPLADLVAPPGFRIAVFASGLTGARQMAISPEGTLVVARRAEIVALPDRDGDGRAEPKVLLSGLTYAHSVAFSNGYLYFTTTPALMRVRWADGQPSGAPESLAELPTSTPSLHTSRSLVIGRDGRVYVSIGSSCNVCVEPDERRTTIQVFDADGKNGRPFATGLRNAVGMAWHPETGKLWTTDIGQDQLSDDLPPDEIDIVEEGKHYGYPFFYGRGVPNPAPEVQGVTRPVTAEQAVPPVVELPAHTTPLGLTFYTGTQFPAPYRQAPIVSMKGSTTRSTKVGYKLVRVVMKDGRPAGVEDFVTGWLQGEAVSGRPVGLVTGADGALYVADDNKGFIYRISYGG